MRSKLEAEPAARLSVGLPNSGEEREDDCHLRGSNKLQARGKGTQDKLVLRMIISYEIGLTRPNEASTYAKEVGDELSNINKGQHLARQEKDLVERKANEELDFGRGLHEDIRDLFANATDNLNGNIDINQSTYKRKFSTLINGSLRNDIPSL